MKTEIKHKLLCNFDHSSMKAVHRTVKHKIHKLHDILPFYKKSITEQQTTNHNIAEKVVISCKLILQNSINQKKSLRFG